MIHLIFLDIKRVFRDFKYVFFVIILPILFYILYNELFATNAAVDGVKWSQYSLVSMIAFGIMGNSINLLGTKIADERKGKWYDYLNVSPINSRMYGISHIFSFLIISIIFTCLMFVVGQLCYRVDITFISALKIGFFLNFGSIVFLFMALIIGGLGSLAQPLGTVIYLFLSFLGGLWMPVAAMPTTMQTIAKLLPSYSFAKLGWDVLIGNTIDFLNILLLALYCIIFLAIYNFFMNNRKYR